MHVGFGWSELMRIPLWVVLNQIDAWADERESGGREASDDDGVRDATQEDIRNFI